MTEENRAQTLDGSLGVGDEVCCPVESHGTIDSLSTDGLRAVVTFDGALFRGRALVDVCDLRRWPLEPES